jgi:predicted dehydrogenase
MSFSSQPIRVGIVGASVGEGWSNVAHLPALKALPSFELVGVATRSLESAEAAARAHGARFAFGDPLALIASPEIEAVTICVRASGHFNLVDQAIAAGKHVYCEWPLGLNSEQSRILASRAAARGVVNMVGLQAHGSPALARIRALIAEGAIGEVLSSSFTGAEPGGWGPTTAEAYAYGSDRSQGATLLTVTTGHALDAVIHCLGEFTGLSAVIANRRTSTRISETGEIIPLTAPDQVAVIGRLENGAVVTMHLRAGSPVHEELRWEINGSDGYLLVTDCAGVQVGQPRIFAAVGGDDLTEISAPSTDSDVPSNIPVGPPLNVAHQYVALARAIRSGQKIINDFEYALRRRRLLDAIQAAADDGTWINMPDHKQ